MHIHHWNKRAKKRLICEDNVLTTFEQDFHGGSYQDEELVQDIGREVEKILKPSLCMMDNARC